MLADEVFQLEQDCWLSREFHLDAGDSDRLQRPGRCRKPVVNAPSKENRESRHCEGVAKYERLPPCQRTAAQNSHQHETDAIDAERMSRREPRLVGEGVADIQPGEAQVVEFAAEVFEAGPDERNRHPAPHRSEAAQAEPRQRDEQSDPKRIHQPQHASRRGENPPEERQPHRRDQQADRQPRIERLPPSLGASQSQQRSEIDDDQDGRQPRRIGSMKCRRRHGYPENDPWNTVRR